MAVKTSVQRASDTLLRQYMQTSDDTLLRQYMQRSDDTLLSDVVNHICIIVKCMHVVDIVVIVYVCVRECVRACVCVSYKNSS